MFTQNEMSKIFESKGAKVKGNRLPTNHARFYVLEKVRRREEVTGRQELQPICSP
jgi:hypothetical protein